MLLLALLLGFVIASPQIVLAFQYYPKSVRSAVGYREKVLLGNLTLRHLAFGLLTPRSLTRVDGLFHPEGVVYIGLFPLLFLPYARSWFWWSVAVVSALLAMGKHTPLFRWTHWCHLRIPARYGYFFSLALAMLALEGLARLHLPERTLIVLVLLHAFDLCMNNSRLMPMTPYTQRWQKPSTAFQTPLTGLVGRISGLPYPLRCGHIPRLYTLGYAGGGQLKTMAKARNEQDPNGSGGQDWFLRQLDGPALDRYGVRYAYTYRPLTGKWRSTHLPHLYDNMEAQAVDGWTALL